MRACMHAPRSTGGRTLDDGQQVALHALGARVAAVPVLRAGHNLVNLVNEHDAWGVRGVGGGG